MTAMESEKDISSDEVLSLIEQANNEVADKEVEDKPKPQSGSITIVSETPAKDFKNLSIEEVSEKYKLSPRTVGEIIQSRPKLGSILQQGRGIDPRDLITDEMLFESGFLVNPTPNKPYSTSPFAKRKATNKFLKSFFKDIEG